MGKKILHLALHQHQYWDMVVRLRQRNQYLSKKNCDLGLAYVTETSVPLDKSLGITLANWDQTHARKNSMSHLYVQ